MSTSTDAILCFALDPQWEEGEEPWKDYDYEEWIEEKFGKDSAIEIVLHCSGDAPMYLIAAKESVTTARRGSPRIISDLEVQSTWRSALRKVSRELKIPDEPKWFLASYWG